MERKCRKTFDSQNEAILHSQTNCDFLVFSYEINYGGCRRFMSSSALEFWSFYKDMEESKRFHYEVIVKLKPCKLYFDIEYVLTYNPLINGHQMTIDFIDFVNSKLKELFCKDISKEDVVILESSSALKFSIHLIFSKVIFSNNNQMGQFVKKILSSEDAYEKFSVSNKAGDSISFVDMTVYTSNRNFRLLYSSKLGKRRPFLISQIDVSIKPDSCPEDIFCSTLVTNVDVTSENIEILSYSDDSGDKEVSTACISEEVEKCPSKSNSQLKNDEVECFINNVAAPGIVRNRKVFSSPSLEIIHYDITGSKFCRKVNRCHRSNNVYFRYYPSKDLLKQGCYSPSCNGLDDIVIKTL